MTLAYSLSKVANLLGLSGEETRQLIEAVFEGPRDVLSFQDLVLLRTAKELPREGLTEALRRVRAELPADRPLSSVTLQRVGRELVINASGARWNASSGQQLLDFGRSSGRGATWLRPVPTRGRDADALFTEAVRLESIDPEAALRTYAEAVAADPYHADAHLNLGCMLHDERRFAEAEALFVAALVARPTDATACFNLAVALEDSGRIDEAIARYQEALELDPGLSDACFNLSRLYEQKGEKVAALRHLSDYRRLSGLR